ncbi:cholecystokinin a [Paramormyrops kingsleyae]|uniref:Cholecystokinin a n=1 Tax=Paramormyrops kingsleyae TaxID=1676925 RepID=A0A3B3SLV5_9TELE|nr:cholecystokinin [Paramormyrops kingsleyae]XP_023661967.1 cholecystokinin [Paramormyrops kingsleyae]
MNSGICVCMLLAALSSAGVGLPAGLPAQAGTVFGPAARSEPSVAGRGRQVRSTPLGDSLKALDEPSLGQLLAQYLSRKGPSRRSSKAFSRTTGPRVGHRIQDRDYLGWMDFGRRSAEEYEYSS